MCGLVGMVGNFYAKHERMMKLLLLFDTLRGPHSTGLAAVDKDRDIDVVKKTTPGWDFIEDPIIDRLLTSTDKVWIGHNRFATVGKINRLNAHPFSIEDADGNSSFVGAHNGTIHNRHQAINEAYSFGTDSEGLMNMIYHHGIEATIPGLEGAWALTWYDRRDDAVFFIRNKERPLFVCNVYHNNSKADDTLAWASEKWMLEVAAERAELSISEVKYFEENRLHWINLPDKVGDTLRISKGKEVVEGKPSAPFQTGSQTVGNGYSGVREPGPNEVRHMSRPGGHLNDRHPHKWDRQSRSWYEVEWDRETKSYVPKTTETTQETKPTTQEAIEEARTIQSGDTKTETSSTTEKPTTAGLKAETTEKPSSSVRNNENKNNDRSKNSRRTRLGLISKTGSTTSPSSVTDSHLPHNNIDVNGGKVLSFRVKGFEGELLDKNKAEEILEKGCVWCCNRLPHSHGLPTKPIVWLTRDVAICKECESDTHEKPDAYTGLFDDELNKVQKGHAKITRQGEIVLKEAGLTQKDIEDAIMSRAVVEAARQVG